MTPARCSLHMSVLAGGNRYVTHLILQLLDPNSLWKFSQWRAL